MKATDWSSVPRPKRPLTNGPYRPKSGSRARSDRGLTVDGDRTQGSSVEIEAMLKKIHRICARRTASYGESRNILILVTEKRMGTNASNRSRGSYKSYAITSVVGYFGFVVVML